MTIAYYLWIWLQVDPESLDLVSQPGTKLANSRQHESLRMWVEQNQARKQTLIYHFLSNVHVCIHIPIRINLYKLILPHHNQRKTIYIFPISKFTKQDVTSFLLQWLCEVKGNMEPWEESLWTTYSSFLSGFPEYVLKP